jgi:lipopolysaccharide export system protein LptC
MTASATGSDNTPPEAEERGGRTFAQLSFRRERPRYSPLYGRFVGFAKILLPTIATALIVIVVIWPELSDQESPFTIKPTKIDSSEAENLRMVNARFMGVDASKQPFSLTADSADQTNPDSPDIALVAPKADILVSNGAWIALTATRGNFNRDQQILELTGNVNLFHDSGYEFHTESAVFDLTAGDATGTEPVTGQGPFGQLRAEGFRIYNRGERVEFTGKAKLTISPKARSAKK